MKKLLYIPLIVIGSIFLLHQSAFAQEETRLPTSEYFKAKVTKVLGEKIDDDVNAAEVSQVIQELRVKFLNGPEKDSARDVPYYSKADGSSPLAVNDIVYVAKITDGDTAYYAVTERYRVNGIMWLMLLFAALVIIVARRKGIGALLGLAFSFAVIAKFMVPQILLGRDPLLICLAGAIAIALVSIYIAHGFNTRTTLAVISTVATVMITLGLDYAVIHWLQLFGGGSEEAVYAQFTETGIINLRGLLLGGIVIGVLGVLDDITTSQAAVVDELRRANPLLSFKELYLRGISVGKEHIASLVNTLVLAYVGASFPLVLLFQHYQQPFAYIINSELVAEEIARALIGSTALIIAVPLTTALSAYVLKKRPPSDPTTAPAHTHGHHH